MTLFTAEGLLQAYCLATDGALFEPVEAIYQSYLGWLFTRIIIDEIFGQHPPRPPSGWLVTLPELELPPRWWKNSSIWRSAAAGKEQ